MGDRHSSGQGCKIESHSGRDSPPALEAQVGERIAEERIYMFIASFRQEAINIKYDLYNPKVFSALYNNLGRKDR